MCNARNVYDGIKIEFVSQLLVEEKGSWKESSIGSLSQAHQKCQYSNFSASHLDRRIQSDPIRPTIGRVSKRVLKIGNEPRNCGPDTRRRIETFSHGYVEHVIIRSLRNDFFSNDVPHEGFDS